MTVSNLEAANPKE